MNNIKEEKQNIFLNDIKVDTKELDLVSKKRYFLEEINGNEQILNKLPINILKKLEKYYDGVIIKNETKIKNTIIDII